VTDYLSRVWQLRHFWLVMVRNDLRNRYRRSLLGIGWSLLQPIAMTIVLCVVFRTLFRQPVRTYAPYLLCGLTLWTYITGAITQGCQCFFQGESYIRQQPAPLAIYALRTVLGAGFHFLLGLGIALAFSWYVNGFGNLPALLSLVPTLLLLLIAGWSLAVCMGVMNVLFQDSQHLIDVALQALFYLTPVMYYPDRLGSPQFAKVVALNPLSAYLDLVREPILYAHFPPWWTVALASAFTLGAFGLAVLALARFEKRIIFYL
jgi:lipopolysaccharide transport system permease protein